MINDAWNAKEVSISTVKYPVVSKAPCPMSGQPAPPPEVAWWPPQDRGRCPDCMDVVSIRANGNFYRHIASRFSEPRDVIVIQTGAKQVIEIAAADVPEFIAQLRAAVFSTQEVS